MKVISYTPEHEAAWNSLVAASKNGTFLFDRRFMDYHSDRFSDCSLLFFKDGKPYGAFPANYDEAEHNVYSHQGLTYGGLILPMQATATEVLEMFDQLTAYYRDELKAQRLIYRPVPYIYNKYPAEEPLYALFRHNARLTGRGLSSAVPLQHTLPPMRLRRRGFRKAEAEEFTLDTTTDTADIQRFWEILRSGLVRRHQVEPVHSAAEIKLLTDRLPEHIRLYALRSADGQVQGGAWLFFCGPVVHVQYMASADEARHQGANDLLTLQLINHVRTHHPEARYYEFGVSTEQSGHVLNEGLIFQKEGFGARGVCYDSYEMEM